jgi:phosphoribosyl-ATP pyrophosphohydrolase/phosphoribosyl-AMP cyclohydrolase
MHITADNLDRLDFQKGDGLLPAVVQDATSGAVLMVGWMNPDALRETLRRGRVVFWSRSRGSLWEKGETSGHTLSVHTITADCDLDTLLVTASPAGPTCHLGTTTCFGEPPLVTGAFIGRLQGIITSRLADAPTDSYTAQIAEAGVQRAAQKVGEEGVETALAAVSGDREALTAEAADLVYHLLLLLKLGGSSLEEVERELSRRHDARQSANSGAG